jgi:hypothetical protein
MSASHSAVNPCLFALALTVGGLSPASGATPAVRPDLPSEARQFDFWIGTWDVDLKIRQEDGSWPVQVEAEARIFSVLDDKAILELWDSDSIIGFSLRYYDPGAGEWKLWLNWPRADRSGSSGLAGGFHHGRGEFFSRRSAPDGGEQISRYTFSDITPDRLRWDDAFSSDGGATWRHGWIMEFTRKADRPELPVRGGPAHTYDGGGRCTLAQFRRFEALAGRREGSVEWRRDGGIEAVPATLVAWPVLEGCAVLSELVTTRGGEPYRRLYLHAWNTYASVFEESRLDSLAGTSLDVSYGSLAEGEVVEVVTSGGGPRPDLATDRSRWRLDGTGILLERQASDDGTTWVTVEEWRFVGPSD